MSKQKDKFGKTDVAQILVGAFVIASGTFMGQDKSLSLLNGVVAFLILLTVATIIFSITSLRKKGILLRIAVTVPSLFIIALLLEYVITQHINFAHVFLHTGIALPISAGIDALRD